MSTKTTLFHSQPTNNTKSSLSNNQQQPQHLISDTEREYLLQGIRDDCRTDGRQRHEWRRYSVTTGLLPLSHGSARCGSCLCSVKAELILLSNNNETTNLVVVEIDQQQQHPAQARFVEQVLQTALSSKLRVGDGAYWKLHIDVATNVLQQTEATSSSSLQVITQCIRYALADTILPNVSILESADTSTSSLPHTRDGNNSRIHLEDGEHKLVDIPTLPSFLTVHFMEHCPTNSQHPNYNTLLDATPAEALLSSCVVHLALRENKDNSDAKESTTPTTPTTIMGVSIVQGTLPWALFMEHVVGTGGTTTTAKKPSSLALQQVLPLMQSAFVLQKGEGTASNSRLFLQQDAIRIS